MQNFVNTYGEDGKTELNTLASAHEIILIPDNEEKYDSGGLCDIVDGKLRLFFRKSELGYWVTYCSREIDNAVNTASKTISPISFIARNSIKTSWDSQIKTLRQKFQTMLQLPEIIFDPNFGANFVEINKLGTRAPSDWEKSFGQVALNYFERLYEIMEKAGYGSDDMMREAFTMTVEMNKVSLRATEHLVHKSCNELHIAEGVLYIQVSNFHQRKCTTNSCGHLADNTR